MASIPVSIGVALQAAGGNLESLYVGRLIAYIAIGIASTVNPLYVSENAPRGIRGFLTGLYQLRIVTGLIIAFWVNHGSLLHITGDAQYIIPLSLLAVPAVILGVVMALSNESPQFLAQKSPEKALRVLAQLRGLPEDHPYVRSERALFADTGRLGLLREAFASRANRRRTILCVTPMMWSNLTVTNAMTYYSPTIFASLGLSGTSAELFATGVYGCVKMVTCAIFIMFVADTLGRRKSLLWTAVVQGLALFYVGFYIRFDPPVDGNPVSTPVYVAIAAIYVFAAAYQFAWGPVVWT